MQDRYKKKDQLIRELAALRLQFAALESAEQQREKLEADELEIMNEQLQLKMIECNRLTDAFRATFEQAAVGVAHVQPDGRYLLVNQKMCDILGYTREDLLGKTFLEITHPYDLTPNLENVRKVLTDEIKNFSMEKRCIRKNGSLIWVNLTVSLVRDLQGSPVYFISVVEDISEHKKLEEQLFQAQKMEAIGQLAGGIAHDFNNLLTAVIGYGHLLKAEVTKDEQASSYVNQILSASERAAVLTNELLTFSRKQIIRPQPVDLNNTIREVEKLLSRIIGEDIEFTTILSDKDLTITADSTQIEQLLLNLATNARDAMPDGGTIIISTDRVELGMEFIKVYGYGKPGPYALIAFEDTGTGMDERTKERIFEPFFTTKAVGKGTGLGLAMVYGIIKQHEGYINAYSEPGKGTTFKIFLPLIQAKAEDKKPAGVFPVIAGTETILIGEDDLYVRKFIKEMLLKNGYTIFEAVDGEDTVRVFSANQNEINLVILDVIMPKKNGKDVYNEIIKMNPGMKVIFISGYSSDIIHKRGILEEKLDIISKPIMPDELLTKVRRILDT
jgi:PAS domain S-box-containing protein